MRIGVCALPRQENSVFWCQHAVPHPVDRLVLFLVCAYVRVVVVVLSVCLVGWLVVCLFDFLAGLFSCLEAIWVVPKRCP